jgi:hypothetical protein
MVVQNLLSNDKCIGNAGAHGKPAVFSGVVVVVAAAVVVVVFFFFLLLLLLLLWLVLVGIGWY